MRDNTIDIVDRLRRNLVNQKNQMDAAEEIEKLRRRLLAEENAYDIMRLENELLLKERDDARLRLGRIFNEIDCRIEHGADSNGHLEAIRNLFKETHNEQ